MVFCSGCGADIAQKKFCPECGQKAGSGNAEPAAGVQGAVKDYNDNLPKTYTTDKSQDGVKQVTGAVRGYMAGASDKEKESKTGQQKWGLFETNYQRTKGITTEQSLQEIEDAMKNFNGGNSQTTGTSGSSSNSFGSRGGGGASDAQFSTAGGGSGGGGQFGSKSGGGSSTTTHKAPIEKTGKFGSAGNAGSAAFAQFQNKQAAKYKPKGNLGM